eukprot:1961929-Pyramimonas_sp.AAC.1
MRQWKIADGLNGAWWRLTAPEPSAPMCLSLLVDEVAHIAMLDETMHFPAFVPSGDDDNGSPRFYDSQIAEDDDCDDEVELWDLDGADDDGTDYVCYLGLSDTGALCPGAQLLSVEREWKRIHSL